jgi:hypothetical protein
MRLKTKTKTKTKTKMIYAIRRSEVLISSVFVLVIVLIYWVHFGYQRDFC